MQQMYVVLAFMLLNLFTPELKHVRIIEINLNTQKVNKTGTREHHLVPVPKKTINCNQKGTKEGH